MKRRQHGTGLKPAHFVDTWDNDRQKHRSAHIHSLSRAQGDCLFTQPLAEVTSVRLGGREPRKPLKHSERENKQDKDNHLEDVVQGWQCGKFAKKHKHSARLSLCGFFPEFERRKYLS